MQLPSCGLYKTSAAIGAIPAGRLVYFHNHGDPGPGVYLPTAWRHNRAEFESKGQSLEDLSWVEYLEPLPTEGFYRVTEAFHCCEKRCQLFEPDMLLQLGYNANAEPILFLPELVDSMLAIPAKGWKTDLSTVSRLRRLRVPVTRRGDQSTQ